MKTYLLIMVCVAVWDEGKCGMWNSIPVVQTDSIYLCRRIENVIKLEMPTARTECSGVMPMGANNLGTFGRRDDR